MIQDSKNHIIFNTLVVNKPYLAKVNKVFAISVQISIGKFMKFN